jgi:hypothetical protein
MGRRRGRRGVAASAAAALAITVPARDPRPPGVVTVVARGAGPPEQATGFVAAGSPVIGDGGELLGVVFARSDRDEDRAWAVDARAVAALLGD